MECVVRNSTVHEFVEGPACDAVNVEYAYIRLLKIESRRNQSTRVN